MGAVRVDAVSPVDRVVTMFREAMSTERVATLDGIREGFEVVLEQLPVRADAVVTAARYGGVDGYWVRARGAADDRIGVLLHGGGFVMGSAQGYRAFASDVSSATGARVFVPDYRLAPEHPFPAGLEDASSVLEAATGEVGPERCFVIGDSAGGGLAVSSFLELRHRDASLPACLVLVSALIDLTVSNSSFRDRADRDPICAQDGTLRNVRFYLGGRGPADAPSAFPMLSDLGWFPPCLVLVGGREVLRDDSRNLADKLECDGADVTYHEYEDMIHVWPLFSSFVPEGGDALEEIGAFVSGHLRAIATGYPSN